MPDVELKISMFVRLLRQLAIGCPLAVLLVSPSIHTLSRTQVAAAPTPEVVVTEEVPVVEPLKFHELVKPLGDLISRGEGDYNAVNRGWAGDTPGGIKRLTGSSFAGFTVRQVIDMQRGWLYAVGRYQFIPRTLRFAVSRSDVRMTDKFTNETQDKLFAALLIHKRPAIGAYIRGEHNSVNRALDALAREWASVEYRYGRGYYDHIGGNRASISRVEAHDILVAVRAEVTK